MELELFCAACGSRLSADLTVKGIVVDACDCQDTTGYDRGYKDGRSSSYEDGYEEGFADGKNEPDDE